MSGNGTSQIVKMLPECNLSTLDDGRGGIYTYYPDTPIVEVTVLFTRAGESRGFHYHKEFDEYALIVEGVGVYIEECGKGNDNPFVHVGKGDFIQLKSGVAHTLRPISDMTTVAFLTKKWNDCEEPITRAGE